MRQFAAVVEKCAETGLYVGYVPGLPGAHSQGATLDELRQNLQDALKMLAEDRDLRSESDFIGTQTLIIK